MPTIANGSVAPPTVANHMISSPDGWPTSARELPMRFKAPSLSASPTYGWSRLLGAVVVSFFFVWSALSGKVSARLVILCWMLASITMNVINKEVAIRFEAPSFALFLQMVFAVAMFSVVEWRNLTCGKLSDLLKWSVVPFFLRRHAFYFNQVLEGIVVVWSLDTPEYSSLANFLRGEAAIRQSCTRHVVNGIVYGNSARRHDYVWRLECCSHSQWHALHRR